MTDRCGNCTNHHESEYGPEFVRCRWRHGDTILYSAPHASCSWSPSRFVPIVVEVRDADTPRAEAG